MGYRDLCAEDLVRQLTSAAFDSGYYSALEDAGAHERAMACQENLQREVLKHLAQLREQVRLLCIPSDDGETQT